MNDLLLAIDTAGSRCAVALCDRTGAQILSRRDPDIGRGHAEVLIGLVAEVLAEAGASYGDIRKIAVVVGPGSFTGLRVGVSAAKGLALALDIACVGITSLEALAEPHWNGGSAVLSVIDAKRGELYAAVFGPKGAVLAEPIALVPADLPVFVDAVGEASLQAPLAIVGSGAGIASGLLERGSTILPDTVADIASVARIGASRTPSGSPRPLYLRGADAKPQAATGVTHVTRQGTLP